jgi:hypothetical protein
MTHLSLRGVKSRLFSKVEAPYLFLNPLVCKPQDTVAAGSTPQKKGTVGTKFYFLFVREIKTWAERDFLVVKPNSHLAKDVTFPGCGQLRLVPMRL